MSQSNKVSEIIDSLHEHIEEQKKLLDEENKKLLKKGEISFKKALANKLPEGSQNKDLTSTINHKSRKGLNIRRILKKIIFRIIRLIRFLRSYFQKLKKR